MMGSVTGHGQRNLHSAVARDGSRAACCRTRTVRRSSITNNHQSMSRVQRYTILALAAASAAAVILVSCQTTNPMYNPNKSHHTVEGFRNNYSTGPRGSFWKWQRERWEKGLPKVPEGGYHFEQLRPDVAWLKANRVEPTLTWIGHATFLLQLDGLKIGR